MFKRQSDALTTVFCFLLLVLVPVMASCAPIQPSSEYAPQTLANTSSQTTDSGNSVDSGPPEWEEIFTIGEEAHNYSDLANTGFRDVVEFTCHAGLDCEGTDFPAALYLRNAELYSDGVREVTIAFDLTRDYSEVILRLVRAGSETSAVTVDGETTHYVTNEMLGSAEGWIVGSFDLSLGAMDEGNHAIALAIREDGKGNEQLGWDALSMKAR